MSLGWVSRFRRAQLADLLLVARMFVWMLLVPVLKRLVPLPAVARLMWVDRPTGMAHRERQQRIVRGARLLLRTQSFGRDENCLDRSLILYRFLSREMLNPRLVLGVQGERQSVKGHAWVTVDGTPVVEAAVPDYAPIAIIGPRGSVEVVRGDCQDGALAPFGAGT